MRVADCEDFLYMVKKNQTAKSFPAVRIISLEACLGVRLKMNHCGGEQAIPRQAERSSKTRKLINKQYLTINS